MNYLREQKTITLVNNVDLIYSVSIVFGGLIGGGIFLCLLALASVLFGGVLGFLVAVFILSFPFTNGLHQSPRIVILSVLIVLGMIVGVFLEKPILIISTATLGSYCVFSGADVFLKTGFGSLMRALDDNGTIKLSAGGWLMILGFLLLSIIGSIVQFRISRAQQNRAYSPPLPEKQV